jgi:hypothetical protein
MKTRIVNLGWTESEITEQLTTLSAEGFRVVAIERDPSANNLIASAEKADGPLPLTFRVLNLFGNPDSWQPEIDAAISAGYSLAFFKPLPAQITCVFVPSTT